ncbi:hypothetical protein SAMN05443429_102165 [Cruoricaptor ignavus]|uniref:Uncharacterized protein n=1 Tax=Cruoricaptor ignavus TaxID=1118202 RepID=A0A1M6BYG1_9FLAO|nr:hypothetical protein [Cruoricaptor ignavus]SHI53770.1 hypothetical protein SAMN05443429_102165 [Cruoricaptor ignavus]
MKVIIEEAESGFYGFAEDDNIEDALATYGCTVEELKEDFKEVLEIVIQSKERNGDLKAAEYYRNAVPEFVFK